MKKNLKIQHHQHSRAAAGCPEVARSTRDQAIEAGVRRYFSGVPCPADHVSQRYTLNGYCVDCQRERNLRDRARARAKMVRSQ